MIGLTVLLGIIITCALCNDRINCAALLSPVLYVMIGLTALSTQSHLTTCYASRHYAHKTGRVISAEGIGLTVLLGIIITCALYV